MSFSQKYQGKILVPWYNSSEWRYVYNILHNQNEKEYLKALQILKVWKIRTPLLSAGVEGTLIILEALTQNKEVLSDEQIVQTYSISLLRFLNLTAGNSEKQGNFNQTVKRNNLPQWLVDIRHDIAHNNRLPSKAILELSMKECLEWTIEKYWKEQNDIICDYIVTQNPQDLKVTELLNMYCELNINLHYKRDMNDYNEALFQKINYMVMKKHKKPKVDFYGILEILEEMFKQSVGSVDFKNSSSDVVKILTSERTLFAFVKEENVEELENIPQSFKMIWGNILNMLIEHGVLFSLAKKLHEITNDFLIGDNIKKASSLWVKEIVQGLLKLKVLNKQIDNYSNSVIRNFISLLKEDNYLNFHSVSFNCFNTKMFEEYVLSSPNLHTLNYLYFLLYINNHTEVEVDSIMNLVESMVSDACNTWEGGQIVSVEQMEENLDCYYKDIEKEIKEKATDGFQGTQQCHELRNWGLRKWRVVANKLDFEGCPLGVLPHQDRSRNPCYDFDIM